MTEDITRAPLLKIQRANRHIQELQSCVQGFFRTDFYTLSVDKDPDTGHYVMKCAVTSDLPEELPTIIGDVVHNLRSSLDVLWSGMCRALGQRDSFHFPIDEERGALEKRIKQGVVTIALPAVEAALLDAIQPYKGGTGTIWQMNRLNRADKHRLLVATLHITRITGIDAEDENHNVISNLTLTLGAGQTMNLYRGSKMTIKSHGQPAIAVLFDIEPVHGQPVIETLIAMRDSSEQAIRTIGAIWKASSQ